MIGIKARSLADGGICVLSRLGVFAGAADRAVARPAARPGPTGDGERPIGGTTFGMCLRTDMRCTLIRGSMDDG
jgi:hypothetical protein